MPFHRLPFVCVYLYADAWNDVASLARCILQKGIAEMGKQREMIEGLPCLPHKERHKCLGLFEN